MFKNLLDNLQIEFNAMIRQIRETLHLIYHPVSTTNNLSLIALKEFVSTLSAPLFSFSRVLV